MDLFLRSKMRVTAGFPSPLVERCFVSNREEREERSVTMELSLGRQIAKRTVSEAIAPTATSWAEFKEGRYKSPSFSAAQRRHPAPRINRKDNYYETSGLDRAGGPRVLMMKGSGGSSARVPSWKRRWMNFHVEL